MSTQPKIILDYKALPSLVENYRHQGKKIILTHGTFDLIHIGHARYLKKAKSYGDILFVGVDSDEKVKVRKGPERPVVPQEERLEMLTYLQSVDHVVLKQFKASKWQLTKIIQPDILVAVESTYTPEQIKELNQYCRQVVILKPQAITSTSAKLRRLQIGFVQRFSDTLTEKVQLAIEDVIKELKK